MNILKTTCNFNFGYRHFIYKELILIINVWATIILECSNFLGFSVIPNWITKCTAQNVSTNCQLLCQRVQLEFFDWADYLKSRQKFGTSPIELELGLKTRNPNSIQWFCHPGPQQTPQAPIYYKLDGIAQLIPDPRSNSSTTFSMFFKVTLGGRRIFSGHLILLQDYEKKKKTYTFVKNNNWNHIFMTRKSTQQFANWCNHKYIPNRILRSTSISLVLEFRIYYWNCSLNCIIFVT